MTDYRTGQARCPGCEAILEQRIAGEAEVDVCPECSGLWVDWFDGELVQVARAAAPLAPARTEETSRDAACPRCARPLGFEWLESGAAVRRCGECAGVFVPRTSFDAVIAEIERAPEPTGVRGALLKVLRFLFPKAP